MCPLYEYFCNSCDHEFEEHHSIADRKLPELSCCTKCKKKKIEQKLSSAGIAFDSKLKPGGDFRERMKEIKKLHKYDRRANIKDY